MRSLIASQWWGRRPNRAGELTAAELSSWLSEGRTLQLLDIRDAAAFQRGHLPGARPLRPDGLDEALAVLDRSRVTVVY